MWPRFSQRTLQGINVQSAAGQRRMEITWSSATVQSAMGIMSTVKIICFLISI